MIAKLFEINSENFDGIFYVKPIGMQQISQIIFSSNNFNNSELKTS